MIVRALLAAGVAAGCAFTLSCGGRERPADLVLLNGRIVTMDDSVPEAQALAARDGRIVRVGSDDEVRKLVGSKTRVLDLRGRLAVPGLTDSHAHLRGIGRARSILDLAPARTWNEIAGMVRKAAGRVPEDRWILGRGWHQEKWDAPPAVAVEGYPTNAALDQAVPGRPVLLTHASGHAVIASSEALRRAGIRRGTPDPPGGEIVRDAGGNPTGVLLETAADLAQQTLERERSAWPPERREAEVRDEIQAGIEECLSHGITSIHDAGEPFETLDLMRRMADHGELRMRLYVMVSGDQPDLETRLANYRILGAGDHHLTVRAVKAYMDGALGSHGAWMLEPYADLPESTGMNVTPLDRMEKMARAAGANGFQMCTHAIGDRANRETLDLYQRVLAHRPDGSRLRWRIEHAQHLNPADIPRFAQLGVIAAMQPIHCVSDGPWVEKRIGPRRAAEGAYAWRSLLDSGAVVTAGTDAPVESVDPIANFHAAVTRRMADGAAFHPEQAMTRAEALRSYTRDAAYAAFQEDLLGTLAAGKLADITVLSRDILTVPEERIRETRVDYTIVGGRVAYERESREH